MARSTSNAVEREVLRQRVREACRARGIAIVVHGLAFHLLGPGVDLVIDDLAGVRVDELQAPRGRSDT